jgi:hypothetical protein
MQKVAIISTWNNALWIEHCLRWSYPFFTKILIQEANWTSDDKRWAGASSPDGTAERIRAFPDPDRKIQFYQLGRWEHGCLAARAELCSRIPPCDWVYVLDVDEFVSEDWLTWVSENLPYLKRQGYTTLSQHTRSFYWDFTRHTTEGFTRWFRWYSGINCWAAQYARPADFSVPTKLGPSEPLPDQMGPEIFHFSYVPPPGVEIKGAQSFDVSPERYRSWYETTFRRFDGTNLPEVYAGNDGGVHVFGGLPVREYTGNFPAVLADHPLRHARWIGDRYVSDDGSPLEVRGWWSSFT